MHNIINLARCAHEVYSSLMKKSYVFLCKKCFLELTLFSFSRLPSSNVCPTVTELFGPSPRDPLQPTLEIHIWYTCLD